MEQPLMGAKKIKTLALYQDVLQAYLKFKSYIYHENFSVNLKIDLARFEQNHTRRLRKLAKELEAYQKTGNSLFIDSLVSDIGYYLMPKKFKEDNYDPTDGTFITNKNTDSSYTIDSFDKIVPFFKGSIELHIISTLWALRIGISYEKGLSKHAYANRLYSKKDLTANHLRLFKRYYNSYNSWRDNAIEQAKFLHETENDVAILNLDIRSYYHSIDLNLSKLKVYKHNKWLNQILISIHDQYIKKLIMDNIMGKPLQILPIGLVSSSILANFYLRDLDRNILSYATPSFYGRYVDDFLFVFKNPIIDEHQPKIVSDFIEKNIISKKTVRVTEYISKGSGGDFEINIKGNLLQFQVQKVKLYYFKKGDSIELLEEFRKEIEKNSSEFRIQLEEQELKNPFEEYVYKITYSDTINKLRSIDSFKPNKFGASKQLAKIIGTTKYLQGEPELINQQISRRINNYFRDKRSLQLFQLWEKAFAYFVVNNDSKGLIKFSNQLIAAISKVRINITTLSAKQNAELTKTLYEALMNYLKNGYAAAAALDINFFDTSIVSRLKVSGVRLKFYKSIISTLLRKIKVTEIKRNAQDIISANLFNHFYIAYPLLNYCKQPNNFSFSGKVIKASTNFDLDPNKIQLSPRYINFDEVELFNFLKSNFSKKRMPPKYLQSQYLFNRETHWQLNSYDRSVRSKSRFTNLTFKKGKTYDTVMVNDDTSVKDELNLSRIRIGLANLRLNPTDIESSIQDEPILSLFKLNQLNKALNEAIRNDVNIIVFPEVSVPLQWISKLAFYSRKNNIAIICGVEHFTNKKDAFNYVCTILPFYKDRYLNAHVNFRLKKDYSPGEIDLLAKYKLNIPQTSDEKLRLFIWKNLNFSIFNCFELADIEKRSLFRGKVDIVIAVEYNPDTIYFSNINESYARDIHAYTIQVNSSDYGDSRITMPKKSEQRDYIKIKGGENVSLVMGDLDVTALREFQQLSYNKQLANRLFKPTPPNFVYQR